MRQQLLNMISQIPFWVWVLMPVIMVGVVTLFVSKNVKTTLAVSVLALVVAWLAAGFHSWEVYLHNHFFGEFDDYGLPTIIYRNGWHLMIDAWQIWLVPTILGIIITILTLQIFNYVHQQKQFQPHTKSHTTTKHVSSNQQVTTTIEVQQLKQQIHYLQNKYQEQKQQHVKNQPESSKEIEKLTEKLKQAQQVNQQLTQQIDQLQDDITRAKTLIEKLLNEQYS